MSQEIRDLIFNNLVEQSLELNEDYQKPEFWLLEKYNDIELWKVVRKFQIKGESSFL